MNALVIATVSVLLGFTSPPEPVTNYFGYRWFTHGRTDPTPLRMWADSALTVPWTPVFAPNTREAFFVWTDSPNRTDEQVAIYACNAVACSKASNFVIVSTGLVDSVTYFLGRGPGVWTEPKRPKGIAIGWALAVGDSADWSVVPQQVAQDACMTVVCSWPAWMRRYVVCP